MISVALLRIIGGTLAISAVIGALFWIADAIGDAREAKVRAAFERAIDETNAATVADNDAATKVAMRDLRIRDEAVAAYRAALGGKCPLSTQEAETLARIR